MLSMQATSDLHYGKSKCVVVMLAVLSPDFRPNPLPAVSAPSLPGPYTAAALFAPAAGLSAELIGEPESTTGRASPHCDVFYC